MLAIQDGRDIDVQSDTVEPFHDSKVPSIKICSAIHFDSVDIALVYAQFFFITRDKFQR